MSRPDGEHRPDMASGLPDMGPCNCSLIPAVHTTSCSKQSEQLQYVLSNFSPTTPHCLSMTYCLPDMKRAALRGAALVAFRLCVGTAASLEPARSVARPAGGRCWRTRRSGVYRSAADG